MRALDGCRRARETGPPEQLTGAAAASSHVTVAGRSAVVACTRSTTFAVVTFLTGTLKRTSTGPVMAVGVVIDAKGGACDSRAVNAPRPCVAAMRASLPGSSNRSITTVAGRFVDALAHNPPPSAGEAKTPTSVPT